MAITAIAAGWTVGTAVVTGTGNGTATAMGSNGLTAGGAGTIVLVSPIKIITNVAGTLAAFGVLTLTYVPEPGTLLLLGLGVAGLASGGLSALMTAGLYRMEDLFGRLPVHWMWWPAIGGLVVGVGGFLEPRALGVGYDVIGDLLANHLALTVVASLLLVKVVIWMVALASGTSDPPSARAMRAANASGRSVPSTARATPARPCTSATGDPSSRAPRTRKSPR